jgi:hypothetical protein
MKSDEELKQTFKVFVDQGSILEGIILKEVRGSADNTRRLELIEEVVLEIFNKNPEKEYGVSLDLLPLGKGNIYTSVEDRKIWARLASNKQIKKCAVIGSSIILKVIASFVIRLSSRSKDIKWFSDKEEALKWLKEE